MTTVGWIQTHGKELETHVYVHGERGKVKAAFQFHLGACDLQQHISLDLFFVKVADPPK